MSVFMGLCLRLFCILKIIGLVRRSCGSFRPCRSCNTVDFVGLAGRKGLVVRSCRSCDTAYLVGVAC